MLSVVIIRIVFRVFRFVFIARLFFTFVFGMFGCGG